MKFLVDMDISIKAASFLRKLKHDVQLFDSCTVEHKDLGVVLLLFKISYQFQ